LRLNLHPGNPDLLPARDLCFYAQKTFGTQLTKDHAFADYTVLSYLAQQNIGKV
jgi:hypothetical protein